MLRLELERVRDAVIDDVSSWARVRQDDITVLVLRRPWVVLAKEARCAVLLSRQATGGRGFA